MNKLIKKINTYFYIFFAAYSAMPIYYTIYMLLSIVTKTVDFIAGIMIIKIMAENGYNDGAVRECICEILFWGIVLFINTLIDIVNKHYNIIRKYDAIEKIQSDLMKKSSMLHMKNFDSPQYYDNVSRVIEYSQEKIIRCVDIIISILSCIVSTTITIISLSTINILAAVFPLISFFVCFYTLILANKIKYKMQLILSPINRKKYYSRRIFYDCEYVKDVKLTHISSALYNQFEKSIDEERTIIKGFAVPLSVYSLLNYILGWTFFVFFLPPCYLLYGSLISRSIRPSDAITFYNVDLDITYALNAFSWELIELQELSLMGTNFKQFMELNSEIENGKIISEKRDDKKQIRFEDVCFWYSEGKKIINNFNFTINKGESVAIVGRNGVGKSTFIKLLLNIYQPTSGIIYLGNIEINTYDIYEYRNKFEVILQDYNVYAMTIKENITLGREDIDDETIYNVIEKVGLLKKIQELPNGIYTQLTKEFYEDGTVLSGGEAQRMVLCRVLLSKKEILVLDEPFSKLDAISEEKINNLIINSTKGKQLVFISHRLNTVKNVDRILLFENGNVVADGNHFELMNNNATYAKMFNEQSKLYFDQ